MVIFIEEYLVRHRNTAATASWTPLRAAAGGWTKAAPPAHLARARSRLPAPILDIDAPHFADLSRLYAEATLV